MLRATMYSTAGPGVSSKITLAVMKRGNVEGRRVFNNENSFCFFGKIEGENHYTGDWSCRILYRLSLGKSHYHDRPQHDQRSDQDDDHAAALTCAHPTLYRRDNHRAQGRRACQDTRHGAACLWV